MGSKHTLDFNALSNTSYEAITRQLETLRRNTGAKCVFLADMLGQRLAETGDTAHLDIATLLSLLAGGFATSGELARRFGNGQAANLNFHQGARYDVYSANVGDDLFLAIVYDRQVQSSSIGLVWLYTRRTVAELLPLLSSVKTCGAGQPLETEFGSSLLAELDMVLTEHPSPNIHPSDNGKNDEPDISLPAGRPAEEENEELLDLEAAIARGLIPPDWGG